MNLIKINNFKTEYSENLFPATSVLDSSSVINKTAGSVDSIAVLDDTYRYEQNYSIKSYNNNFLNNLVFNLGNDFTFTTKNDGIYILSFRLFHLDTPSYSNKIKVNIFLNGILTYTSEANLYDTINDSSTPKNKWLTFCNSYNINSGVEVSLTFEHILSETSILGESTIWVSGFKFEYDDRFLGIPSIYSLPTDFFVLKNNTTGWEQITDTSYTSGSPLSITSGVTAKILNNGGTRINTQLPSGVLKFWNESTNKIVAVNNGDAFTLSLRFKAKMDVANGITDVGINIGGSLNVISQETLLFSKGSGVEQRFDIDLSYFTGTTFIANGGDIEVTPLNGNIEIYDIVLVIIRTHKGF